MTIHMEQLTAVNLILGLFGGAIVLAGAIFGVAAFVVRSKDMQALKPQIDQIPLMNATIGDIRQDIGEIKGTLSVVPAMEANTQHNTSDIVELKSRVRELERREIEKK